MMKVRLNIWEIYYKIVLYDLRLLSNFSYKLLDFFDFFFNKIFQSNDKKCKEFDISSITSVNSVCGYILS